MLLVRVNSTKDVNYGAVGYPKIDQQFYLVNGKQKRFFNRDEVIRLFNNGWSILSVEEKTINRYIKPKAVWEVVVNKL